MSGYHGVLYIDYPFDFKLRNICGDFPKLRF